MDFTFIDAVTAADALMPNNFMQMQKRKWIYTLESKIRYFMSMYGETDYDDSFTKDDNANLILGYEGCDIYVYYLLSMIDMANGDAAMYNNHTAMYNSLMTDWQKKYRRQNKPKKHTKISQEV